VCRRAACQRQRVSVPITLLLLLVAACKTTAPPSIDNKAGSDAGEKAVFAPDPKGKVRFINTTRTSSGPTNVGSIEGLVSDDKKEALIGCTVVLTSPQLVGEQVVISDENGKFSFENLAPGDYTTTYYYGEQTFSNPRVTVYAGRITLERVVDWPAPRYELH
jgi:hypothetical protein